MSQFFWLNLAKYFKICIKNIISDQKRTKLC